MSFGTFFLPGPTEVRREVLDAMLRPMISHDSPEFEAIFATVQHGLQHVFGTQRPVYISTSSATGLMEAGIRCAPPGPLLALVNGVFSERFAQIAEACGRVVTRYEVPWGEVHEPRMVLDHLEAMQYSVLTVVHSETSTGALNDIRMIAEVARSHGVTALIDSVSGVGGAELRFDDWQLDYVLTGSQKALALPPGLAFAVASVPFIAGADTNTDKGRYFDLTQYERAAQRGRAPSTPALSLFYALERQLRDVVQEGIVARCQRHMAMAQYTWRWAHILKHTFGVDVQILAPEGKRSPTVTTLVLPSHLTSSQVAAEVAARGFTIGTGRGKLATTTIRIGHMGDHTESELHACLQACSDALRALNKVEP